MYVQIPKICLPFYVMSHLMRSTTRNDIVIGCDVAFVNLSIQISMVDHSSVASSYADGIEIICVVHDKRFYNIPRPGKC